MGGGRGEKGEGVGRNVGERKGCDCDRGQGWAWTHPNPKATQHGRGTIGGSF